MIEFTIKTLDSNNHAFSVDDEITIQQLKEKIFEQMGLEIPLQRLIFCGRVLQDETKLADYNVGGKVVHLVQRAPPSPTSRQHVPRDPSPPPEGNQPTIQQIRRIMVPIMQEMENGAFLDNIGVPLFDDTHGTVYSTITSARIDFIRRMISEIKTQLHNLRETGSDEEDGEELGQAEAMETDSIQEESETGERGTQTTPPRPSTSRRRSMRATRRVGPRDLADLLDELDNLYEQFAYYRNIYTRILRTSYSDSSTPNYAARQESQSLFERVSEVLHSFSHAYHAISDITFELNHRPPHLYSEGSVIRHPMPLQAQINVVTNRMPPHFLPTTTTVTNSTANTQPGFAGSRPPGVQINQNGGNAPFNAAAAAVASAVASAAASAISTAARARVVAAAAAAGAVASAAAGAAAAAAAAASNLPANAPAAAPAAAPTAAPAAAPTAAPAAAPTAAPAAAPTAAPTAAAAVDPTPASVDAPEGTPDAAPADAAPGTTNTTQGGGTANRNTTQPTVNINIQPDPITYQLEIETRVPIAFALDNNLLSGLQNQIASQAVQAAQAAQAAQAVQRQQQPGQRQQQFAQRPQQPGQRQQQSTQRPQQPAQRQQQSAQRPQQPVQRQQQPEQQQNTAQSVNNLPHTRPQPNRQSIFGFENNLMRDLAQSTGVEVLMRVEELQGVPNNVNINNSANTQTQHPESEVFHMPAIFGGGQGGADLLQNIVSAVLGPVTQAGEAQFVTNVRHGNALGGVNILRNNGNRPQIIPPHTVFDRFLTCDSNHARRYLQRRSTTFGQTRTGMAIHNRLPTSTILSISQHLGGENNMLVQIWLINLFMALYFDLFGPVRLLLELGSTERQWLVEMLLEKAREISLRELMQVITYELGGMVPTRIILRENMQQWLDRVDPDGGENAYQLSADHILDFYTDFIQCMRTHSQLRSDIDIESSLRLMARARIPPVITLLMSEGNIDSFTRRFYSTANRLMRDACNLLQYCCRGGPNGLRAVYRSYVEHMDLDENPSVHELLLSFGIENLTTVMDNLTRPDRDQMLAFVVRYDPVPAPAATSGLLAMETAPISTEASPIRSTASIPAASTARLHSSTSSTPRFSFAPELDRETPAPTAGITRTVCALPTGDLINIAAPMQQVLTHFNPQWLPVMEQDQTVQRQRPPVEPYSDAYLAGMSSRKRKRMREKTTCTLDTFINESLREATGEQSNAVLHDPSVRQAFREHLRTLTRTRAQASEEYDPARFPATEIFSNAGRSNEAEREDLDNRSDDDL